MERRERILAHKALVDEDRVLEVVAAPAHERDEQVLTERELALVCRGAVCEAVAGLDLLALLDDGLLVEARAGVAAAKLLEVVAPHALLGVVLELGLAGRKRAVLGDHDEIGRDVGDRAALESRHDDAAVLGGDALETGADIRTLGRHERHALAHHVRAHERAVRVVVLEERNEAGRDGDDLHRRDVHVLDLVRGLVAELGLETARDALLGETAGRGERRVRLGDHELLLLVGGQELDLVGHLAADDLAVRRLDEAEAVDLRVDAQAGDEADVRSFRRLDRADAAVVRGMHVADLEAGALAAEAAGAEGREAALVGEGGKRVRLVHELGELAPREEVGDDGAERLGVDEALRRERPLVGVVYRHALSDEALGAGEAEAALVLEKLARGADAAVAEVVDVVDLLPADIDLEEEADRLDHVDARLVERAEILVDLADEAQLLVDLVAPDVAEVVVGEVEEHAAKHLLRVGGRGRVSRAHALVDFLEGVFLVVDAGLGVFAERLDEGAVVNRDIHHLDLLDARGGDLLHHRGGDGVVAACENGLRGRVDEIVLHHQETEVLVGVLLAGRQLLEVVEELHELLVGAVAEGAEERRRVEFPAAAALVHEAPHDVVRIEHHLDPVAAVGDDAAGEERLAVRVDLALGRDAGRAVQLRDDDALGAVDDERAVGGHHRHVAEEHLLLAHFAGVVETERREERTGVGLAIEKRLEIALLRRTEIVADEIEGVARVLGHDGEYLLEYRLQALVLALRGRDVGLKEVLVGLCLDLNEVRWRLGHPLETAEYFAFCTHLVGLPLFSPVSRNEEMHLLPQWPEVW